jgi:hypothetical protein
MAGNRTDNAKLARGNAGGAARIARILLDCGMIGREELEIVRRLMQGPPAMKARRPRETGRP